MIAKKRMGMIVATLAAAIVIMSIDQAQAGFAGFSDKASAPATSRRPMAEDSAMMNPNTLLRRRSSNPDFAFWSDMGA